MKQFFLPLGLIGAVFSALLLPVFGIFISENSGLKILVFVIFLVSGYQAGAKALPLNGRLLSLFLTAAAISLVFSPLLGLALTKLIDLPFQLAIGLIVIATVPPTLSSGIVITEVSRGNTVLALFLTVTLNLVGIFSMPFMLDLCLRVSGPVNIDQAALLVKLLVFVFLPFAVGKQIRSTCGKKRVSSNWSYVNSSCVILVVYASLAVSRNEFAGLGVSEYGIVLASVSMLHLLLLAISSQGAKMLRLVPADRNALVFVASQKTLPISVAVLTNISYDTGSAIIVCLIFHFFQLFADSFLAGYLRRIN